jgi:hypothetical protein
MNDDVIEAHMSFFLRAVNAQFGWAVEQFMEYGPDKMLEMFVEKANKFEDENPCKESMGRSDYSGCAIQKASTLFVYSLILMGAFDDDDLDD